MDRRVFGLRNEVSVVFSGGGRADVSGGCGTPLFGPVVSGSLSRSVLLRNRGRLHLDVPGRPVYATPECGSALDLVIHDKAGERVLEGLLADAPQLLREEGIAGDSSVLRGTAEAPSGPAISTTSAGRNTSDRAARGRRHGTPGTDPG